MNFMNVHKLTNVFKNFSLLQSSPSPSPKKASEATTAAAEDATMDFTAGAESKVEADLTVKSAAAEVEDGFSGVATSDVVKVRLSIFTRTGQFFVPGRQVDPFTLSNPSKFTKILHWTGPLFIPGS